MEDQQIIRGTYLKHGKPVFIAEISETMAGESVRVVGRISSIDFSSSRCKITHRGSSLQVDTSFLDSSLPFKINALVCVIGELDMSDKGQIVLRARVHTDIEGLSLDLYDKTVALQRTFLSKFEPPA